MAAFLLVITKRGALAAPRGKEKSILNLSQQAALAEDPSALDRGEGPFNPGERPSIERLNATATALGNGLRKLRAVEPVRRQPAAKWQLRAVEPGIVRVSSSPLSPSKEVLGVVWEGKPMPLDNFLTMAGDEGWEIVAAGNIGERHHRLYLKRPA